MTFFTQIKFGFPEEWQSFQNRHPELIEKLKPLFETLNKVFIREMKSEEPADKVIFYLGRLAVEDLMEILLLCGNGYGIGGMKILRVLYERAVTLRYIAKNPKKAEDFLDYHHVHLGKLFNHARRIFGNDMKLSSEQIADIQSNYDAMKEKYKEIFCAKCGSTRIRMSWSELDILSMAREAELDNLYLQCYYEPLLQAHTTVSSLIYRLKWRGDYGLTFDEGAQHKKADLTLIAAHNLILYVIKVVNEYFKMGLDDEIEKCFEDFLLVWKKER
jgi:hypothetical protein